VDSSDRRKLGSLIVELGLIDNRDLGQALSIAQETSLPLGRVLVLSDLLSENVLQGVLRCQSLFKQNLLEADLAKTALKLVSENHVSLDDALFKLGWNPESTKDPTPLGELLIEAEYVTRDQLQPALDKSASSGLPFGRILVLSGVLTEGLLTGALNAQILVRDGKLAKPQAVEALKEARQRQVSVEVQLKEKGFYELPNRSCPRLGELLLFCGVISQSDLVHALELGLMNKAPVGQVLIDSRLVTPKMLDAALRVQAMMAGQNLNITDARTVIAAVKEGGSFEEALQQIQVDGENEPEQEPSHFSLFSFLRSLGRIDDGQVADAFQLAKHNSDVLSQVLLISGTVDPKLIGRAEKCRKLVQDKKLSVEHANIVFDYSERFDIDVAQALKELQWNTPDDDSRSFEVRTAELPALKQAGLSVNSGRKEKANSSPRSADASRRSGSDSNAVVGRETASGDSAVEGDEVAGADSLAASGTRVGATDSSGECDDVAASSGVRDSAAVEAEWDTLLRQAHQLTLSGKLDKALDTRVRLLHIAEESKPDRRIDCLDSIASLYSLRRNFEQAEHYYLKSLELREKEVDPQQTVLAEAYCNLGKIYYFQKKFSEAEDYARKFIRVIAENFGKDHPDVACGWQNLGNIFYVQKKYRQAQQAYQVGVNICENKLGAGHPTTEQLRRSYSALLNAIDEEEKAGAPNVATIGFITGSWRTLPKDHAESLYDK
jgi:tetratricopeptide (TPR) repeat protein